jgi:hypothetical protein
MELFHLDAFLEQHLGQLNLEAPSSPASLTVGGIVIEL